jgi:hypothetical protein
MGYEPCDLFLFAEHFEKARHTQKIAPDPNAPPPNHVIA